MLRSRDFSSPLTVDKKIVQTIVERRGDNAAIH